MPLKTKLDLLLAEHQIAYSELRIISSQVKIGEINEEGLEIFKALGKKVDTLKFQILETIELIKSEYANKT